jgi:hypothetical protein
LSDKYDGVNDEFGIPVQSFVDTAAALGGEMKTRMRKRALTATSNYLYLAGIPKEPAELLGFAEYIASSSVTSAIVDEFVALNEKGHATEQEREAMDAATQRQSAIQRMFENERVALADSAGGYL